MCDGYRPLLVLLAVILLFAACLAETPASKQTTSSTEVKNASQAKPNAPVKMILAGMAATSTPPLVPPAPPAPSVPTVPSAPPAPPSHPTPVDLDLSKMPPVELERRLQRLQEQRRLCARCDCFALRKNFYNVTLRVSLDENLDEVADATTTVLPARTGGISLRERTVRAISVPPQNQVLVINCTSRLLAEELPRWSWPARLSAGETVADETWAEFRGGDLSGVSRLPHLPFLLTRLSLADNRLRSIASKAFANLNALRDLDLSHNVIAEMPQDSFSGLTSLQRLNLSRNSLNNRPLTPALFKELGKLTRVSLSHNKLAGDLNADTLPWSGSIQELDLSFNELASVGEGAWRQLPNIKILDLSHNKIKSLTPNAFAGLRSLERLNLSWNALTALPTAALFGLVGLRSLDMSHNTLRVMPASTFTHLNALASLDLSSNAISPDNEGMAVLEALPASLRTLDLSRNALGWAQSGLEGQQEKGVSLPAGLEDLSLDQCGLHGFDVRTWGGLHAVRRLRISGNDISVLTDMAHLNDLAELNVSRNSLTRFSTVSLPALRTLDLSHNQLERAPNPLAPRLAVLLLDDNPMEELRVVATSSLALLSAQNMPQLRSLPSGALSLSDNGENATACVTLALGNNHVLKNVHENALEGVSLCRLDLSHNALTSLPSKLANWTSLQVLDLQGNPWSCTCPLQWMLDTVVRQLHHSSPELLEDFRCAGPEPAVGRRLVHWFNHTGRALCDGELMNLQAAGGVTLKVSSAMLVVIATAGVVAIGLVGLGFLAHRKAEARRRNRNRRF